MSTTRILLSFKPSWNYEGRDVDEDALAKRRFHELLRPGGRVIQIGYSTMCMPFSLRYVRRAVAVFNTLGRIYDYLGTVDEHLSHSLESLVGRGSL